MSDESSYFEWAFKGLVAIVGTIGLRLWTNLAGDVKNVKNQANLNDLNLLQHKLDAERTYANKADIVVIKQETKESLDRVHDRLDDMGDDIKTILGKLGH